MKTGLLDRRLNMLGYLTHISHFVKNIDVHKSLINAKYRIFGSPDGLPIPPPRLVELVIGTTNLRLFFDSGYTQYHLLIRPLLEKHGFSISSFGSILDFGCGCGRLTRLFKPLNHTRIVGVDYNQDLIDWCQQNLVFGDFYRNSLEPPLPFVDGTFDFILARSIFTHMSEDTQFQWFKELHRLISKDGIFIFTVHGSNFINHLSASEQLEYNEGHLIIHNEQYEGENICAAFHPQEYINRTLPACGFQIIDMVPGDSVKFAHQDTYLAKKR